MSIRVRETVHHGSYRNVREVVLPDTSPEALGRMAAECPYVVSSPSWWRMEIALGSGGSYSHGWVTWEVVK